MISALQSDAFRPAVAGCLRHQGLAEYGFTVGVRSPLAPEFVLLCGKYGRILRGKIRGKQGEKLMKKQNRYIRPLYLWTVMIVLFLIVPLGGCGGQSEVQSAGWGFDHRGHG